MRTFPSPDTFVDGRPLEVTSFDALWERATTILQSEGYPVDPGGTSRRHGEIASGWSGRFTDVRRRAFVLMDEGPVGQWVVRVAVERERNDRRQGPFGGHEVEWEDDGADPETAQFLLFKIEMPFRKAGGLGR
jgi:hypothetical protein